MWAWGNYYRYMWGSIPPASSTQVVVQKEVGELPNSGLSPGLAFPVQNDARFLRVAEVWEGLSEATKARIMTMVEAEGASQ